MSGAWLAAGSPPLIPFIAYFKETMHIMTLTRHPSRPGRALAAALLAVSLGAAAIGAGPTEAHAGGGVGCDPIVTLTNGAVVHLTATVYDSVGDITAASYAVHAPMGTSVRSVVYPLDPNNIPQTFHFYADNLPNVWDSYTNVSTKTGNVPVTATVEVANFATFSASGQSNQNVWMHGVSG